MIKRREEIIEVQTGQEYQEKYGAGRVGGLSMDENVANANVENAGDQDVMISVESRERAIKMSTMYEDYFLGVRRA